MSNISKGRLVIHIEHEDDDVSQPDPDIWPPASANRIGPLLELSGSPDPAAVLGLGKGLNEPQSAPDRQYIELQKARAKLAKLTEQVRGLRVSKRIGD